MSKNPNEIVPSDTEEEKNEKINKQLEAQKFRKICMLKIMFLVIVFIGSFAMLYNCVTNDSEK